MSHTEENQAAENRLANFIAALLRVINREQLEQALQSVDRGIEDSYSRKCASSIMGRWNCRNYLTEIERQQFENQIEDLKERVSDLQDGHNKMNPWYVNEVIEGTERLIEGIPALRELAKLLEKKQEE